MLNTPDNSQCESRVEPRNPLDDSVPVARDELAWMREIASGNEAAISELLETYQAGIRSLVGRLTAWDADVDDLTQEVFLKAWQRAHQFSRQRSLQNWLFTIAVNTCRNHRRGLSRWWKTLEGFFERKQADGFTLERDSLLADERWLELRNAMSRLRMEDRTILVLTYTEEKTTSEIIQILQITENNYYVRLHRAKERLAKQLKNDRSRIET